MESEQNSASETPTAPTTWQATGELRDGFEVFRSISGQEWRAGDDWTPTDQNGDIPTGIAQARAENPLDAAARASESKPSLAGEGKGGGGASGW